MSARLAGFVVALVAALAVAPASAAAQVRGDTALSCPRPPDASLATFDTTRVRALAGAFDIVLVDTTRGARGAPPHRGRLTLWVPDSMARTGHHVLVGAYDAMGPDTSQFWRRMGSREPASPGVMWSYGAFRLGEYGVGMGITLHALRVGATEVLGNWVGDAGIGIVVDYTLKRPPEPAGIFCARRAG